MIEIFRHFHFSIFRTPLSVPQFCGPAVAGFDTFDTSGLQNAAQKYDSKSMTQRKQINVFHREI